MTSERTFLRQLQQRFPVRTPVVTGIGDDGAVLAPSQSCQVVVTDMLLDGRHFNLGPASPGIIGRKSLTVNLSDLAAMACRPTAAFISIAVPEGADSPDNFLGEFYDGVEAVAREYGFTIAGGDTTSWDGPLAVNVCMTGTPFGDQPVLRSGGCPGDILFVTGALGGSLKSGRHLAFEPRLAEAEWLTTHVHVNAMMDISDGLALDLHRLAEQSGCGAAIDGERIPISSDVDLSLPASQRLQHALADGEDFELLLAIAADDAERVAAQFTEATDCSLTGIGQMTAGADVLIHTGDVVRPLTDAGWQCFR